MTTNRFDNCRTELIVVPFESPGPQLSIGTKNEHYGSQSYTQYENRPKFIFVASIQMASNFTYGNLDYHTDGKMPIGDSRDFEIGLVIRV